MSGHDISCAVGFGDRKLRWLGQPVAASCRRRRSNDVPALPSHATRDPGLRVTPPVRLGRSPAHILLPATTGRDTAAGGREGSSRREIE